jgi:citrate lyase subunit beta/citryl-CoA lyase
MQPIRSLLFAPANRPDLIHKFVRYQCDAFAIDLEDGTPLAEKAAARGGLATAVASLREQRLQGLLFVRVNDPSSPLLDADLTAVLGVDIDGIMVPKLSSLPDLRRLDAALASAGGRQPRGMMLIGLIETAAGVLNVETLTAAEHSHLSAVAFGAEDFVTDIGGMRTAQGLEVLYARSRVVLAARAAGLIALDQVFVDIRDEEGFRRDAQAGRQLGYSGKMCVTPRQAAIANEVFAPSPAEVDRSRRLIQAYEQAKAEGRGTIEFEGGMVDEPLLRRAEAMVAFAGRLGQGR